MDVEAAATEPPGRRPTSTMVKYCRVLFHTDRCEKRMEQINKKVENMTNPMEIAKKLAYVLVAILVGLIIMHIFLRLAERTDPLGSSGLEPFSRDPQTIIGQARLVSPTRDSDDAGHHHDKDDDDDSDDDDDDDDDDEDDDDNDDDDDDHDDGDDDDDDVHHKRRDESHSSAGHQSLAAKPKAKRKQQPASSITISSPTSTDDDPTVEMEALVPTNIGANPAAARPSQRRRPQGARASSVANEEPY